MIECDARKWVSYDEWYSYTFDIWLRPDMLYGQANYYAADASSVYPQFYQDQMNYYDYYAADAASVYQSMQQMQAHQQNAYVDQLRAITGVCAPWL